MPLPFLEPAVFLAGTGVPDWLTVADRRCGCVEHAEAFSAMPIRVCGRGGRCPAHIRDERAFSCHPRVCRNFAGVERTGPRSVGRRKRGQAPFAGTALRVFAQRSLSPFPPAFLAICWPEVLLDAALIADDPSRLSEYYRVLGEVDRGEWRRRSTAWPLAPPGAGRFYRAIFAASASCGTTGQ